jgi:transporter family-2 protein
MMSVNNKGSPIGIAMLAAGVAILNFAFIIYIWLSKTIAMKNDLFFLALALITGALIPIQAATNAAFSKSIGNPSITGLMVFIVGLVGMILFILLSRTSFPPLQQLTSAPLYGYLGGIIVATYVVMITILVPRIGVGTAIGLIVTGQIICAVAIDHFGLFNVAVRSINSTRVAGILLMISGVYLVIKK